MNPLWSDTLAQDSNIQHILDHLYGDERVRLDAAVRFIQPQKPILLIGIASAAFPLPSVPEAFAPVLEVVPIQALAYKLAEVNGIDPGMVRYISRIIKEEASK